MARGPLSPFSSMISTPSGTSTSKRRSTAWHARNSFQRASSGNRALAASAGAKWPANMGLLSRYEVLLRAVAGDSVKADGGQHPLDLTVGQEGGLAGNVVLDGVAVALGTE